MGVIPLAVGGGAVEGPTTTSGGIPTVSAAATANTKGAYTQLVASTGFDYDGLLVMYAAVSANVSYLLDVAIGAAASEVIIAGDIHTSWQNNIPQWFYIPRPIPAGTRIAARCQSSTLSSQMRVSAVGVKGGWFAPSGGGDVVTLGANTADSGGTPIDAGATANTFGAWVQLAASTTSDIKGMCCTSGGINNATPTTGQGLLQIGVGAAAAEQPVLELPFQMGTAGDNYGPLPHLWLPCSIPAGSRVAARWMSTVTDATDRIFDVVAHGWEA